MGLEVHTILADAGFSSGENYATIQHLGLNSYIPVHGSYKPIREGFLYDKEHDLYTCVKGHKLHHRQIDKSGGYIKKRYLSSKKVCDKCPLNKTCVGKRGYKEINHTIYKNHYDQMIQRLKSEKGKLIAPSICRPLNAAADRVSKMIVLGSQV